MIRLLVLFFSFSAFSQTIDKDHELLWEVSGKGLKENSYLFGSLHSNDKRLFNLTDSTYYAMDQSDMIVLEADVFSLFETLDTRKGEVSIKYDNKGEPYTGDVYSTETLYGDEDGAPQFLDAYFQQYSYNAGKEFSALETIESQFELLDNVVPDFSQMRIESFLTSKETMTERYLAGDIYGLHDVMKMSLSIYPDLYKEMIIDRNFQMANGLDSIMKMNQVFCAVGAGHLAGPAGLINLLRSKGYSVRKVMASYTEKPTVSKNRVKGYRSYDYVSDTLGIHVQFPGKPAEVFSNYEDYDVKLIYRDFGQGNTYEVEIYGRDFEIGLADLASRYIASPAESPYEKITLDNGGEAFEGLADSYPVGIHWTRVIMSEQSYVVIRAYGGNKFMNSPRPFRFFDQVWLH